MLLTVNNREYNKAKANGFKGSYAQFAEGCNKVNSELLNSNQVVSARKYFNDLGQTTITDINNLLINDLKKMGVLKDEEIEEIELNATDVEELSLISSETTAAVKTFFEKPANVAIASVFATLLVISAFNWKKIAQLMK